MRTAVIVLLMCATIMLSTNVAIAKGSTVAIYAIVDKVAFEPNEESPDRIRIWGVFVVPVPLSSGQYKPPQRGYVYFRIDPGLKRAEEEWAGLKAIAGTDQVIGFGQYWVNNTADPTGNPHHSLEVRVYNEGEEGIPSVYPLPHKRGIVRNGDESDLKFDNIVNQLRNAARG